MSTVEREANNMALESGMIQYKLPAHVVHCSLEAPYHLPLYLSPPDGLHIEVALAFANTKTAACRRYIMYPLLRGVSTKKTCG